MAEVIDPIWIAWAAAGEEPRLDARPGLWRVREHYRAAGAAGPLELEGWTDGRVGLATLALREREVAMPPLVVEEDVVGAFGYVPTAVGERVPAQGREAASAWTRELLGGPDRLASRTVAPLVAGAIDRRDGRLLIVNDLLGAGRLYETEADGVVAAGGGRVTAWSNRLGALPLFLGGEPSASAEGWLRFAAAAWFIGEPTAIEGARRVPRGSVIEVRGTGIGRRFSGALEGVVAGPMGPAATGPEELLEGATEAMRNVAAAAATRDGEPLRVDLSGGRDSRLAAAAAIAAGADVRLLTSDLVGGEADVARELLRRLPDPPPHDVRWAGERRKVHERLPLERAANVHLVHDGMRHAAKLRGKNDLPQPLPRGTTISGHGGEIAHGFYLSGARAMRRVAEGGTDAALERLRGTARRSHAGALPAAYEAADEHYRAVIEEGLGLGLTAPRLLDWFYLTERFAHRSGLAADSARVNLFAAGPFIRASFALSPPEILDAALHRRAIARLVPAWRDVPFFAPPRRRRMRLSWRALRGPGRPADKRELIWEGADGEQVGALIESGGAWSELYDPDRVRGLWSRVRAGEENAHFQDVFEGIVYREAFEKHLALLAERARAVPDPAELDAIVLGGGAG